MRDTYTLASEQSNATIEFFYSIMSAVSEMVLRLDNEKRTRKTLGIKRAGSSTQIQECSTFVRSANEHELDILQSTMRKMEANQKSFRDVHEKQVARMKRFHNIVHARSADLDDVGLQSPSDCAPDLFINQSSTNEKIFPRRNSEPVTNRISLISTRRLSVQPETSKSGRSFRKLKDAITSKSKITPCTGSTQDRKFGKSKSCPLLGSGDL